MRILKVIAAVAIAVGIVATAASQTAQPGGNAYVPGSAGGSVAFGSVTSGTNTNALVVGTGGTFGVTQAIGTATVGTPVLFSNSTAATSGNEAYSPPLDFCGNIYTGGVSEPACWQIYGQPSTTATNDNLEFCYNLNGGAFTCPINFSNLGTASGAAFIVNLGGVAPSTCGNCYYFIGTNNPGLAANGVKIVDMLGTRFGLTVPAVSVSGATNVTIASGTGACATTSTSTLSAVAGRFTCTGTTGASTVTLTFPAITTTYVCPTGARDVTTAAVGTQTGAESTTSVTFSFTSVTANDVIDFNCPGGF
jgi:hypothetical protein